MKAVRKTLFSLGAACFCLAACLPADAADTSSPRLVLPRTADVRLLEGAGIDSIPVGLVLDVLQVEGEQLWVGRGWVRRVDVIGIDEAIEFFSRQIASRPSSFAFVSRARALIQSGADAEALEDCAQALALTPAYAPAFCQRGRAYTGLRRYNDALDALNRAVALDPKSAVAFSCRAQTFHAMGDSHAALADFDRAVELDDKLIAAYFGRGCVRSQRGDDDGAVRDFTAVLRQHPGHYPALNNRANIWSRQEQWERAIEDYSAALQIIPRPDIFMNRAHALRGLGRIREAVADCNEAVRLAPQLEAAYRQRAALLVEQGRHDEAKLDLNQAEQLAVDSNRT